MTQQPDFTCDQTKWG